MFEMRKENQPLHGRTSGWFRIDGSFALGFHNPHVGRTHDAFVQQVSFFGDHGHGASFLVWIVQFEHGLVQVGIEWFSGGIVLLDSVLFEDLEQLLLRHLDPFVERSKHLAQTLLFFGSRFHLLHQLRRHALHGPFERVDHADDPLGESLDAKLRGILGLPCGPFAQVFHVRKHAQQPGVGFFRFGTQIVHFHFLLLQLLLQFVHVWCDFFRILWTFFSSFGFFGRLFFLFLAFLLLL
mmetsp:Transcript_9496/g.57928  ORF Transcript_9496/g.57928 Transcript_9496/m.57928 type:complete len:238 (-) Transcript_9496:261-974(-)